jgi:hypothetical protein
VNSLRAKAKLRDGAYGQAIDAAKKALKKNPKDAEMPKIIKDATDLLQKEAATLAPPR